MKKLKLNYLLKLRINKIPVLKFRIIDTNPFIIVEVNRLKIFSRLLAKPWFTVTVEILYFSKLHILRIS